MPIEIRREPVLAFTRTFAALNGSAGCGLRVAESDMDLSDLLSRLIFMR